MPLLQWTARMTARPQRTKRWYAVAGTCAGTAALTSALTGNWTFALAIVMGAGLVFLLRNVQPPEHAIAIEREGFQLDGIFTNWIDCKDFWLVRLPTHTELRIVRKHGFEREMSIQTGTEDPAIIRKTVSQFLPERSNGREHWSEALIRILKL